MKQFLYNIMFLFLSLSLFAILGFILNTFGLLLVLSSFAKDNVVCLSSSDKETRSRHRRGLSKLLLRERQDIMRLDGVRTTSRDAAFFLSRCG